MKDTAGSTWICRGCGCIKHKIWCTACDIHRSGRTLAEMREEKAVQDLDDVLSVPRDYAKAPTA